MFDLSSHHFLHPSLIASVSSSVTLLVELRNFVPSALLQIDRLTLRCAYLKYRDLQCLKVARIHHTSNALKTTIAEAWGFEHRIGHGCYSREARLATGSDTQCTEWSESTASGVWCNWKGHSLRLFIRCWLNSKAEPRLLQSRGLSDGSSQSHNITSAYEVQPVTFLRWEYRLFRSCNYLIPILTVGYETERALRRLINTINSWMTWRRQRPKYTTLLYRQMLRAKSAFRIQSWIRLCLISKSTSNLRYHRWKLFFRMRNIISKIWYLQTYIRALSNTRCQWALWRRWEVTDESIKGWEIASV